MLPTRAYDLEILHETVAPNGPRGHGWCFGLPPGITAEQWPLNPCTGYPLMHGFTLLLPEEYRCHGPDIVGLSFFAVPPDHNDGFALSNADVEAALLADTAPQDPVLAGLWKVFHTPHPRLSRMTDILDCPYAVILLTEREFNGPFCLPPDHGDLSRFGDLDEAQWFSDGAGAAYWDQNAGLSADQVPEELYLFRMLGGVPEAGHGYNRAVRWQPRARDPNAGRVPAEASGAEPGPEDYQPYFYWQDDVFEHENFRLHDWAEGHGTMHIGGTMRPVQAIPEGFSPYHVGFEEEFGGYNFGGGNAQLDFKGMKFDWACG